MKSFLAAAAAAICLSSVSASAATLVLDIDARDGLYYSGGNRLNPGDSIEYRIHPDSNLTFDFALSASGSLGALSALTYGFSAQDAVAFTDIAEDPTNPGLWAARGFLPERKTDQTFSVFYFMSAASAENAGVTLTFDASSPAPVPLPAPILLSLASIAGLTGVGLRRKSKADKAA